MTVLLNLHQRHCAFNLGIIIGNEIDSVEDPQREIMSQINLFSLIVAKVSA